MPTQLHPIIPALMDKLGLHDDPVIVKVRLEPGAKPLECFPNVIAKIEHDDGKIVYGWAIWNTGYMIEAEFHAVWESPTGELLDITPRENHVFSEIAFIKDQTRVFEGKQVNNCRINISGNRLVDDLIELLNTIFILENKGSNATSFTSLKLTDPEIRAYNFLKGYISAIQTMLALNNTTKSPCFCGRNNPYENCHGNNLISDLKEMQEKFVNT